MTSEEARIRLDEHDRYCEACSLVATVPNQGRCERGKMLEAEAKEYDKGSQDGTTQTLVSANPA